jgi:hypothetical protein
MKYRLSDPVFLTVTLIVITTILRLIIANGTGLGIGESYYFRGATNLKLSYFDQPPMFFWLGGITIRLLGISAFALRLHAVILYAGTMWLMFVVGRYLFNAWAGFFATLIMNISFVFTIPLSTWFQPDSSLLFFWMLCVYFLIHLLDPKDIIDIESFRKSGKAYLFWILSGISLGLTTLSKYHAMFLIAGVFLFTIFNKEQRHWLRHPGPYLAIAISCIIALPVLIWNYKNDWVSFLFQGSRAGSSAGFKLHFDWFFRSILGQAMWLAPWIWIPLLIELVHSFRFGKKNRVYSFCFWTAVLPIVVFTLITLWANTGYHFHWQTPGYMMLFLPLGERIHNNLATSGKQRKRSKAWLISSAVATLFLAVLIIFQTSTGFWQTYGPGWMTKKFGGQYDPTIDGVDFNAIHSRFKQENWLYKDSLFVGSTRWWQIGKIDWALKGAMDPIVFHWDPRNHAYFVDPNKILGYDAIIIEHHSEGSVKRNVTPFFEEVKPLEGIDIIRNDVVELTLNVYYCRNFQVPETPMENLPVYKQLTGRPPY